MTRLSWVLRKSTSCRTITLGKAAGLKRCLSSNTKKTKMSLSFKVIKDLSQAKAIWQQLSPQKTLWDDWDFRYCFYKYYNWELFFYTGYLDGQIIGVLTLQYNPEKKFLEFFCGNYMEENKILVKKDCQQFIPDFYKQVDKEAEINCWQSFLTRILFSSM